MYDDDVVHFEKTDSGNKSLQPQRCHFDSKRDMINMLSAPQTHCSSSHVNGKPPMIIMATRQCVQTYGGELGGDRVTVRGSGVQQGEGNRQLHQRVLQLTKGEDL